MNSWDQQPDETNKAFAAFRIYLEAGDNRSIDLVARKQAKSANTVKNWSNKNCWVSRVSDYAIHMANIFTREEEKKLSAQAAQWAERQIAQREETFQCAAALRAKAKAMMDFPIAKVVSRDGKTTVTPGRWTFGDAAKMLAVADNLSRLALGMETDRTTVTGPESGPIQLQVSPVQFFVPEKRKIEDCLEIIVPNDGQH